MNEKNVIRKIVEEIAKTADEFEALKEKLDEILTKDPQILEILMKIATYSLQIASTMNILQDLYLELADKFEQHGETKLGEIFRKLAATADFAVSFSLGEDLKNEKTKREKMGVEKDE